MAKMPEINKPHVYNSVFLIFTVVLQPMGEGQG